MRNGQGLDHMFVIHGNKDFVIVPAIDLPTNLSEGLSFGCEQIAVFVVSHRGLSNIEKKRPSTVVC